MNRSLAHIIGCIALAGLVAVIAIAPALRGGPRYGIWHDAWRLYLVDFCAHAVFARSVWAGDARNAAAEGHAHHQEGSASSDTASAYTVGYHVALTRAWAREPLSIALPFGYAPTMLYVLGPFAAFPNHLAFALWSAFSLVAACWLTHPSRTPRGIGLILFMSPVALACFRLGQTACLAAAALFVVARCAGRCNAWAALALAVLSAKPPIALAAGSALLALGHAPHLARRSASHAPHTRVAHDLRLGQHRDGPARRAPWT